MQAGKAVQSCHYLAAFCCQLVHSADPPHVQKLACRNIGFFSLAHRTPLVEVYQLKKVILCALRILVVVLSFV